MAGYDGGELVTLRGRQVREVDKVRWRHMSRRSVYRWWRSRRLDTRVSVEH
jgi:hypothetical protein